MSAWISYIPVLCIGFITLGIGLWYLFESDEDEPSDQSTDEDDVEDDVSTPHSD